MRGPFAALLRVLRMVSVGVTVSSSLVARKLGRLKLGPGWSERIACTCASIRHSAVPNFPRRFARTAPSEQSILAFANEFGFLGHSLALRDSEPKLEKIDVSDIPVGESLEFWQREIARMVRLVALWELVKRGNSRELSQLVEWARPDGSQRVVLYLAVVDGKIRPDLAQRMRQGRREFWDYIHQDEDLAGPTTYCEMIVLAHEEIGGDIALLERWRHGDPVEPARYFVHRGGQQAPEGPRQSRCAPVPQKVKSSSFQTVFECALHTIHAGAFRA